MRDDGDQFRHYLPLLRRIIILVAVLVAVPVILWTITAFVRTYVGPPTVPTFRPIAAASTEAPASTAALQTNVPDPPSPPIVEARATATDARGVSPATKGSFLGDRSPDAAASAGTAIALAAPTDADPKAVQVPAAPAMPDGAAPSTGTLAAQQPADSEPQADALPAGEPLTGPIPLPRHRPRYFAMVEVPMPRARPEIAGPGASEANAGPLDWLQKIFQPPPQQ